MGNTFGWPAIRLARRLSIILTFFCCAYVAIFLLFNDQGSAVNENPDAGSARPAALLMPPPVLTLKPYDMTRDQPRDIFSLAPTVSPSGAVENTPKGQLPPHLKIVGILIADPSEIVIQDSFTNKTFFIEQGSPQDGIRIVKVDHGQMIINYQGEDIAVAVSKS